MTDKLRALWVKYRQMAVYCIVGVFTTLVNFSLFWLLHYPLGLNENFANTISVISAVLFAYVTNKLFVFKTRCDGPADLAREMLSFFGARGITMLIEVGGGFVLMTVLGYDEMLSKAGLTVIVFVLNYIFSKLFVFKERKG